MIRPDRTCALLLAVAPIIRPSSAQSRQRSVRAPTTIIHHQSTPATAICIASPFKRRPPLLDPPPDLHPHRIHRHMPDRPRYSLSVTPPLVLTPGVGSGLYLHCEAHVSVQLLFHTKRALQHPSSRSVLARIPFDTCTALRHLIAAILLRPSDALVIKRALDFLLASVVSIVATIVVIQPSRASSTNHAPRLTYPRFTSH